MKKVFMLIALFLSTAMFAEVFKVDVAHTKVGFKVKHLMITNVIGHFEKFDGNYEYDTKTGMLKALEGTVEVASVNTSIEKRDNHLRSADFFDVEKFPTMIFVMTEADGDKIHADLTIKGVTKKVEFEYENGGSIKDPGGNLRSGFAIEGKISREDFGITYNKVLEAGGVAIGDQVKIYIEVEGIEK